MSNRTIFRQLILVAFFSLFLLVTFSIAQERVPMTNDRMDDLLREEFGDERVETREERPGAWQIILGEDDEDEDDEDEGDEDEDDEDEDGEDEDGEDEDGEDEDGEDEDDQDEVPGASAAEKLPPIMVVLTDDRSDRMRLMMPIRKFDPRKAQDLRLALIALHSNYDRALDARYALQDGVLWSVFIHPLESLTEGDLKNGINQVRALRKNTGTTFTSSELLFGSAPPEGEEENAEDDGVDF